MNNLLKNSLVGKTKEIVSPEYIANSFTGPLAFLNEDSALWTVGTDVAEQARDGAIIILIGK